MRKEKRLLAYLLAFVMLSTQIPVSALATDDAKDSDPACSCTVVCTEEERNMECLVCGAENADISLCMTNNDLTEPSEEEKQSAEESLEEERQPETPEENPAEESLEEAQQPEVPEENLTEESPSEEQQEATIPEGYLSVFALDGNAYTIPYPSISEEVPMEEIAEDGKMFVTVRDKDGRIVDTTNPNRTPDQFYTGDGRVDLNQSITVLLEFAALKDGEIREDVYYYLDLPKELIPDDLDKNGQKLVDPDEPIELIHQGNVLAFGGIYTHSENTDKPYRLKFNFTNTEDQIEVSGAFQYGATINPDLSFNTTYDNVDFGGAGKVSFTTKEQVLTVQSYYDLNIKGVWDDTGSDGISTSSPNTKINWTATVVDDINHSINTTLKLKMSDGHGFIYNTQKYTTDAPFAVYATDLDENRIQLNSKYDKDKGWLFSIPGDEQEDYAVIIDYLKESSNYIEGSSSTYSFIVNELKVSFGTSNGSAVTGIKKWEICFGTEAYNSALVAGSGYYVNGKLDKAKSDGSYVSVQGGQGRSYGSAGIGNYRISPDSSRKSFGGLPESVSSSATIYQGGYGGNCVSLTYKPETDGKYRSYAGVHYYTNTYAAYFRGNLVGTTTGKYGDTQSLFTSLRIEGKPYQWVPYASGDLHSLGC